jgi:hypothetical protein
MYAMLDGRREVALVAAERARDTAPDEVERRRFERWAEAIRSSRRIKLATYPVIFRTAGDPDLATIAEIEAIEREMTDDD